MDVLEEARPTLPRRPTAADLPGFRARGALLVGLRPVEPRARDGELPGALVVDRNVLEWRLDPTSAHRIPDAVDADREIVLVCNEGYTSSLAAASLQRLGLLRATSTAASRPSWPAGGSAPSPDGLPDLARSRSRCSRWHGGKTLSVARLFHSEKPMSGSFPVARNGGHSDGRWPMLEVWSGGSG